MSTTTPKDKSGKFWKKLGLGKQKSSGDRTPSRPDVANSLRIEPSESTRRNKRLSLISSHNHRRTISETTGNITRSHSAMNIVVPDDTRQVTRSLSRTMSVANTPVQAKPNEPEVVHINKNSVRSEDDNLIAQTAGTMQINSLQDPNQNCLDISDQNVTNTQVDETTPFPQPTDAVDSPSAPTTLDTTDQAIFQSSPTSNTNLDLSTAESAPAAPSRSNLPKLSSLRTSSSSIPRTSSGSSLRQQASCLRQPSTSVRTTSSHDTLSSPIPKTASLTIAVIPVISNLNEIEDRKPTATHTTNEIYYSLDEDQTTLSGSREQELLSDLERERAVIKVLQGQKTAIGKDLEYLSQMVDDLTEDNDRLREQLETQKEQNERSMQDMDLLLEKVKTANASARDAERERETLKRELEVRALDVQAKYSQYEDQISRKDKEMSRLNGQLEQSKEQIKVLKSTMEQLLRVNVVNKKEEETYPTATTPDRITPATSPEIQPMRISTTPVFSQRHSITSIESDDRNPSPRICSTFDNHDDQYRVVSPNKRASVVSKRDSVYTYDEESDDLDDQMRILVKQKERLQSDYSKIPIIGGGPQSRKRKEDLEEQLDSIDSQLSKIKLKIRNRV